MNRTLLALAACTVLAGACARPAVTTTHVPAPDKAGAAAAKATAGAPEEVAEEGEAKAKGADAAAPAAPKVARSLRVPGEYVIYRFYGSFRKKPLTLTQRVVDREGTTLVLDVTLDDGKSKDQLRVRIFDGPAGRGEVLGVTRVENGVEQPAAATADEAAAVYERMLARTTLSADENELVLGSEPMTMHLGGAPVAVTKTSYQVKIGKQDAVMSTFESDEFAWGDVGAEIVSKGGKLLYKAEIVEVGKAQPEPAKAEPEPGKAVAHTTDDDADDDYE